MPEVIKKYILVTKPGIILGNLITTAGGFFLASRGCVDIALLASTLVAISFVVGSGCVFNNWADRDMDRKMTRTRRRVLALGLISTKGAVCYASLLGITGMALLGEATNGLVVAIVAAGFAIYAGVYSLYLKRRCAYAALIGSLAGAAPPLAGYCAVAGSFDAGAVILGLIFSLWQIPHAYAIAIFRLDDYTAAGIPALPVKRGTPAAKKHIIGYISAFTAATLMLTFGGYTGYSTLAVAAVLGMIWLYSALRGNHASDDRLWAKKQFVVSILIIFILSAMMSFDSTVRVPPPGMLLTCAPQQMEKQLKTAGAWHEPAQERE